MTARRAAAWSMTSQYVAFASLFAANVIISRYFLAPADIGLFSVALAAAMIFAMFQDVGISRFVSGQQDMRREDLRDYTTVAMAFGVVVALLVAVSSPWLAQWYGQSAMRNLLCLIAASYVLGAFAIVPSALLVHEMNFGALFWVNGASAVVGNICAIVLAWRGGGAASLAWAMVIAAVLRSGLAMALRPIWPRWPVHRNGLRPLLEFSSASFVISVSGAIGQRSQDLIVGRLLGLAATGLFSRAGSLAATLVNLLTGAISSVFYAAFARKRDLGEPLAPPYLHLVACNTALNWAAMVGLALAAEPLVLILYGQQWAEAGRILRWIAIGEMAFIALPLQMDVPILLGRIRTVIWVNLVDTVAAVALLALGASFGLEAAALSRIAYGLAWWALYAPFQCRLLDLPMRALLRTYLHSMTCALAAGVPLACVQLAGVPAHALTFLDLVGLSGLGVITWLVALWLTRHPAHLEIRAAVSRLWPVRALQVAR